MTVAYFDESIHDIAGFIVGAFVFSDRGVNLPVRHALAESGFDPRRDEFKSGFRMSEDPRRTALRSRLLRILQSCKIGVVVIPAAARAELGVEALRALRMMRDKNRSDLGQLTRCYFDEGLGLRGKNGIDAVETAGLSDAGVRAEQDSRHVRGIQLADLAAHTCATMLLESTGYIKKLVKAGPNSGYDPEFEIQLGFALWASLRYSLLGHPFPPGSSLANTPFMDVASFGLYIGESCTSSLREAALSRFGTNYVGCIH